MTKTLRSRRGPAFLASLASLLSLASLICLAIMPNPVLAEDDLPLPDVSLYKAMLDANKMQGWVQFREFGGRQLVYFTGLQTMHCRLSDIRYSANSDTLDQHMPIAKCDPQQPFNLPNDDDDRTLYKAFPSGTVKTMSVQVVWSDGSGSEIVTWRPCDNVGESTCARLVKVNKPGLEHAAPKPASQSR